MSNHFQRRTERTEHISKRRFSTDPMSVSFLASRNTPSTFDASGSSRPTGGKLEDRKAERPNGGEYQRLRSNLRNRHASMKNFGANPLSRYREIEIEIAFSKAHLSSRGTNLWDGRSSFTPEIIPTKAPVEAKEPEVGRSRHMFLRELSKSLVKSF